MNSLLSMMMAMVVVLLLVAEPSEAQMTHTMSWTKRAAGGFNGGFNRAARASNATERGVIEGICVYAHLTDNNRICFPRAYAFQIRGGR